MNQDEQTNIRVALDHIQKLPSMPSLMLEIMQSFDDESVDVGSLANKISHDQALVAKVMRVANSAFFGLSGQIGSIPEAASVLGFNNLRGLVTAAAVIGIFPHEEHNFDLTAFWRHNIGTAVCAKVLARHIGLNAEAAFTAGMLHDIGGLVIGVYFPQVAARTVQFVDGGGDESLRIERAALGFDHAVLGGEVAKRWHFPATTQQAIALHHTQAADGTERTLADVVYIANLFSHALNDGHLLENKASRLATAARLRLELKMDTLEVLAVEVQRLYSGAIMLIGR
ncbi:ribonuclease Y [mine drainage metagenome]|uniref:Ribonuclease Y n=1 Tax=mine drainage metagenome TaxID=410659 RepID=A0A1J5R5X2_9ZZZZ